MGVALWGTFPRIDSAAELGSAVEPKFCCRTVFLQNRIVFFYCRPQPWPIYINDFTLPSSRYSVLFPMFAPSPDQYIYDSTLPSPGHSVLFSIVAPSPDQYIYDYTLPSPGHSVLFSIVAPSPEWYIYGYTLPSPGHSVIFSTVAPSRDQYIYIWLYPTLPWAFCAFFYCLP